MDMTEVRQFETVTDDYKRLADAIRRGCQVTQQVRCVLFHGNGACAMGAALIGAGVRREIFAVSGKSAGSLMLELFPGVLSRVFDEIVRRNDSISHPQTREQIADWVERHAQR